jgi:predicted HAD superfamily Cof-like phosphohydrolase
MWVKLVDEELDELLAEKYGTAEHLKELCDLLYVTTGLALTAPEHIGTLLPSAERDSILEQQGKASRALYSGLEQYGEDTFREAFLRVHYSNMSKLGEDGKPVLREDGKVLKGPNYKKPDLSDLVRGKHEV